MIENAIRGKKTEPRLAVLIMTYTLASALSISPLEVYKMPSSLVMELLLVHYNMEKIKHEELKQHLLQNKVQL